MQTEFFVHFLKTYLESECWAYKSTRAESNRTPAPVRPARLRAWSTVVPWSPRCGFPVSTQGTCCSLLAKHCREESWLPLLPLVLCVRPPLTDDGGEWPEGETPLERTGHADGMRNLWTGPVRARRSQSNWICSAVKRRRWRVDIILFSALNKCEAVTERWWSNIYDQAQAEVMSRWLFSPNFEWNKEAILSIPNGTLLEQHELPHPGLKKTLIPSGVSSNRCWKKKNCRFLVKQNL